MKCNLPIFVLGCEKRPGLVLPHLVAQTHTLFINPDWPVGPEVKMHPLYDGKCPLVSHYRVFRGWREMAALFLKTGGEVALFLEDDGVPNHPEWVEIVNETAERYFPAFDLIYMAGRCYDPKRFSMTGVIRGRPIMQLKPGCNVPLKDLPKTFGGNQHVFGSCAALVARQFAERMVTMPWAGIPNDVVFPDSSAFAFMPASCSPFTHDTRQGSLIDPTVPQKYL